LEKDCRQRRNTYRSHSLALGGLGTDSAIKVPRVAAALLRTKRKEEEKKERKKERKRKKKE